MLAFYDFPAEHWVHLRTTNPIESTFATIRHRTKRVKGAFSPQTLMAMMFKLAVTAEQSFRRIKGFNWMADVIRGVPFVDGVNNKRSRINSVEPPPDHRAAYTSLDYSSRRLRQPETRCA